MLISSNPRIAESHHFQSPLLLLRRSDRVDNVRAASTNELTILIYMYINCFPLGENYCTLRRWCGAVDSLKIQGIKLEVVLMDTNSQLLKIIIVNIH